MTSLGNKKDKKPPTSNCDDPERIYRIYNVLSYFIVLVVIGLPIWWYTTRVYRATLPLERMFDASIPNKTDTRLGIPLSLDYDVLITIVNPDPQNLHLDIEGEEIDAALEPFLGIISPIADFIVKSQWLYLVELGAIPDKKIDHYALYEEQLPHIITPLEKTLWSHLSPRPCLNLVIYVSHCNVPLFIYGGSRSNIGPKSETNAFLSPRWGGIYIINPDSEACMQKRFKPSVQKIASVFVAQLKKLLAVEDNDFAELQKRKAGEMVLSTRRTLASLAELLSEINSIVISDDVAKKIQVAVENADLAQKYLDDGKYLDGLQYAKEAFKNSEAAFSDPSLLALLYFPDDQKYAVYIPLFLPVMIPVLMSLITVKKWVRNKSKTKSD